MKIICIGRNYVDHIAELNNKKPKDPVVFLKSDSSLLLKNQPFFIPEFSNEIHYEVEILIKIKKIGKFIEPKFSHKYYDQISLGIDFTARDLQNELKSNGLPWEKAKAFDGSALVGRWVNKNNFDSLDNLNFSLDLNGNTVQKGNTSLMLWTTDQIISHVSKFFTLKIGDIIFTGTPSGVGKVNINDELVGKIENEEFFKLKIK
ncbi:MAG: fumarylacetoacetate hydrolase family protein [Flavobacteriaceae bacterium]|jgi:2-keto-4-pentenoate hydratase/2-oxohepta-3-ene-1,7-dioic acid hydratase in catechol pathway|nr:fumarylacetoacetate hydrolase family protein [Flavobacteriaceae bacterium]